MRLSDNREILADDVSDVVLPEQFFETKAERDVVRGVKALMIAVLEDGIRCLLEGRRKPGVRARLRASAAEKWVRSTDTSWPFAFQAICDVLSVDAAHLRRHLLGRLGEAPEPAPEGRLLLRHVERGKHKIKAATRRKRKKPAEQRAA